MYIDALLLLSDAQAVAGADTDLSTNTIDLSSVTPKRQVGDGEELGVGLQIDVAAVTGGGETYTFQVISSAAPALTSPTILSSRLLTAAELAAGGLSFHTIPKGAPVQQYLGAQMVKTGAGANVTITAWVTTSNAFALRPQTYAKGYAV